MLKYFIGAQNALKVKKSGTLGNERERVRMCVCLEAAASKRKHTKKKLVSS